jgi:adenylate kinase family enzyme
MKQKKTFLFFVMGATNVGKSTFLQSVKDAWPNDVHLVEVGKALRAKYPPEYFQGQGNPAHTQQEAIDLCFAGILDGEFLGRRYILVDGQPRDVGQAESIMKFDGCSSLRERAVIELVCPREERRRRAMNRDRSDGSSLALALERLDRDVLQLHEVLLAFTKYQIHRFNTGKETYEPLSAFQHVLHQYGALFNSPQSVTFSDAENPL